MIINSPRFQNVYFQGTFSLPLPSSRLRLANKLLATKFLRSRLHRQGTIVSSVKLTLSINARDSIFLQSLFWKCDPYPLASYQIFLCQLPSDKAPQFFFCYNVNPSFKKNPLVFCAPRSYVIKKDLKQATLLSHGRKLEVIISHARTVVSPRFLK